MLRSCMTFQPELTEIRSAPMKRMMKHGMKCLSFAPMMPIEIAKTTPNIRKIARYPPAFLLRSASAPPAVVHFEGVTAQPLMLAPDQHVTSAMTTIPRPNHTDHQSSVFQSFASPSLLIDPP